MKNRHRVLTTASLLLSCLSVTLAQTPAEPSHELIKDVVFNELRARKDEGFWEYRVEKRVGQQNTEEQQIDTQFGPVYRVRARDGKPLSPAQQREETARLKELLHDPGKQAKIKQEHEADEQRLERLMQFMPDAFQCAYDGVENGNLKLKFQPNPAYNPPTYEARIFHALAGEIWVNPTQKRLVRLNGHITGQVDFGFGLLGRIDKGGVFEVRREQVSETQWKTDLVYVNITGRLILFKTIAKDQREVRSDFKPVSPNLSLQNAIGMLDSGAAQQHAKCCDSAPHRGPDLGEARDRFLQARLLLHQFKQFANDFVVHLRDPIQPNRVPNHGLQTGV